MRRFLSVAAVVCLLGATTATAKPRYISPEGGSRFERFMQSITRLFQPRSTGDKLIPPNP